MARLARLPRSRDHTRTRQALPIVNRRATPVKCRASSSTPPVPSNTRPSTHAYADPHIVAPRANDEVTQFCSAILNVKREQQVESLKNR